MSDMNAPEKEPSELQKFGARYPLYVRIGFALVVLFGMIGNCAQPGDVRPIYVFVFVTIMWACTRMVQEGIDAYRILSLAKKHDADAKKDDREPPGPPAAT